MTRGEMELIHTKIKDKMNANTDQLHQKLKGLFSRDDQSLVDDLIVVLNEYVDSRIATVAVQIAIDLDDTLEDIGFNSFLGRT